MSPFDKTKNPPSQDQVTRKITLIGEQVVKQVSSDRTLAMRLARAQLSVPLIRTY